MTNCMSWVLCENRWQNLRVQVQWQSLAALEQSHFLSEYLHDVL